MGWRMLQLGGRGMVRGGGNDICDIGGASPMGFFLLISEHLTKAHVQGPVLRSCECISSRCNHWIQS